MARKPQESTGVITLEDIQKGAKAIRKRLRAETFPHVLTIEGEEVAEIVPLEKPSAEQERTYNEADDPLLKKMDEWLADESGHDEETYPALKKAIQENRRRTRERLPYHEES